MRSSSSSKQGAESQRGAGSGRISTLHQRLNHALNLARRCSDDKGQKWSVTDIEIQRLVIRSIDAFLECITNETVQNPLVKDSRDDIIGALNGILRSKSESVLKLASSVTLKVVNVFRYTMLQAYVLDLVRSLSSLLSSMQSEVAVSCAAALNVILSNLSTHRENEVWEILEETNAVSHLVHNVIDYCFGDKTVEYFKEIGSLLSRILWRWPPSRFRVWTDDKFLDALEGLNLMQENSVQAAILQLYSSLALCGHGAKKLLQNGVALIQMMVDSMDNSRSNSVRIEAFKLAQCLMIGEEVCSEVIGLCCEPLVKAIVSGMSLHSSDSTKLSKDQLSLMAEACRLALITRWAGDHHMYFWKSGIDRVLLDFLLDDWSDGYQFHSIEELIAVVQNGCTTSILFPLRSYIWDILGWLAAHCAQNVKPEMLCSETRLDTLIICACLAFMDSNCKAGLLSRNCDLNAPGSESACRAVLMMVYSPSKYIASRVKLVLSIVLKSNGKETINCVFNTLKAVSSGHCGRPSNLQVVISLMSCACYLGLPEYQKHVNSSQGIMAVITFLRWWLRDPVHIKRVNLAPHLRTFFTERTCCWPCAEDWEGKDIILVLGLWVLAELLHYSGSIADVFDNHRDFDRAHLIRELEEICINSISAGPRWYAAYVLSYLGTYGFISKLGLKIKNLLYENEYADLELIFSNQESVYVHKVILMVRCSSLLPPGVPKDKALLGSFVRHEMEGDNKSITKVNFSAHVDPYSFLKLLNYVYSGSLQAGDEDSVNRLKVLAKHCNLQDLLHMLYNRNPKWGTPFPIFDLSPALGPSGLQFADVLLEPKTDQLTHRKCSYCSLSNPHLHVHKVILWSRCEYLRALFQSGMQESQLHTIKAPISWTALIKLVRWIYSNKLSAPVSGCLWDNLDINEKQRELQPYIELCWLAEFWLIEDFLEECFKKILHCLDSCRYLSLRVIQVAAEFSQWKLAEVAATYIAPIFHQLRSSGELDTLDENLIEMVRAAAVRLTQGGSHQSY